jgi:ADP-glucose pyrophosphorylase
MIYVPQNLPEAIILCGVKGERLRPITNDIPKPLVKIYDKHILYYVISHLMQYGINRIHIASGYKSEIIKMMVHFCKRITSEMIGEVNEALVFGLRVSENSPSPKVSPSSAGYAVEESFSTKNTENKGKLILGSICTPADISYPTDSKLLNEACEKSEKIIDVLHVQCPNTSQNHS